MAASVVGRVASCGATATGVGPALSTVSGLLEQESQLSQRPPQPAIEAKVKRKSLFAHPTRPSIRETRAGGAAHLRYERLDHAEEVPKFLLALRASYPQHLAKRRLRVPKGV